MKRCELCDSSHPDDVDQCECGSFCFNPEVDPVSAQLTTAGKAGFNQNAQTSEANKKTIGCGLVALSGAAGLWILHQLLEGIVEDQAKRVLDPLGNLGYGLLCLGVGLGLLIIGPICMNRENRERLAQDRKPKYRLLEKSVVFVGGLVFSAIGIGLLFWL